jgi:hypothetical protein
MLRLEKYSKMPQNPTRQVHALLGRHFYADLSASKDINLSLNNLLKSASVSH